MTSPMLSGSVASVKGEPTPERGGRRKRIYRLTGEGLRRLQKMKDVEKRMWEGIPNLGEER